MTKTTYNKNRWHMSGTCRALLNLLVRFVLNISFMMNVASREREPEPRGSFREEWINKTGNTKHSSRP